MSSLSEIRNTRVIRDILDEIYGRNDGGRAFDRIIDVIERHPRRGRKKERFTERDIIAITYGDTLSRPGQAPLATLNQFASDHLADAFSTIHILPFFPYSSDDGFSVIDHVSVDPNLGSWDHIESLGQRFQMIFDFVVNHLSSKSVLFEDYLSEKNGVKDLAIEVDQTADLSRVIRARSHPLLTRFQKHNGVIVHLWTTFSADQIDLNFKSIDVLERMVDVMLSYADHGASILRLDAIAYLWKDLATECIHLNQTHAMVRLFRAILDAVAPDIAILTETNVPHRENVSYFGNGLNEAQMVYNFTLPPLLLATFLSGDSTHLSKWAKTLQLKSKSTTFVNFTASHDGIGVRPLEGILPDIVIASMAQAIKALGGRVSYRKTADGREVPYELNSTYLDAILGDLSSDNTQRFLASQAIQYALPGVPATYIHSLLGSRNWVHGVELTQRARTINREKIDADQTIRELHDPESFRSRVFTPYIHLIKVRRSQEAFHPNAECEILEIDPRIFAIRRCSENQNILALTNISSQAISISRSKLPLNGFSFDLLSGRQIDLSPLCLEPYEYLWLIGKREV